jgi:hypothetical protein
LLLTGTSRALDIGGSWHRRVAGAQGRARAARWSRGAGGDSEGTQFLACTALHTIRFRFVASVTDPLTPTDVLFAIRVSVLSRNARHACERFSLKCRLFPAAHPSAILAAFDQYYYCSNSVTALT